MKKEKVKSNLSSKQMTVIQNRVDPFVTTGEGTVNNTLFWRWGDDNMLPWALSIMSRKSTLHRRVINDKADYIAGRGFSVDKNNLKLKAFVEAVNSHGESLRQLLSKVAFDKCLFGNAFVEIVTDEEQSFIALYHQDASKCRVAKDNKNIILHHNWREFSKSDAENIPLYPNFKKEADQNLRSIIHYKDYESMFENYGVPPYIAGMNVSAIAHKTDQWNINRLDNSFQLSGVMMLDASVDSEQEAQQIVKMAESKFGGKPGQVMFMLKDGSEGDNSKFIPMTTGSDGDWNLLHQQASSDIVIAHSWFRALSGLEYSQGFSSERIMYEYNIAMNTVIIAEQKELMEPIQEVIQKILKVDVSSLEIINKPPMTVVQKYMKIWEARKAEGLDYDSEDEGQQKMVSEI